MAGGNERFSIANNDGKPLIGISPRERMPDRLAEEQEWKGRLMTDIVESAPPPLLPLFAARTPAGDVADEDLEQRLAQLDPDERAHYEKYGYCRDCGADIFGPGGDYYMVYDQVWQEAGAPPMAFLCLGCLARRLGRRLDLLDFTMCPINQVSSARLAILRAVTRANAG